MSEVAETLLRSDDYGPYIRYDESIFLRTMDKERTEQDELECGTNLTGNIFL